MACNEFRVAFRDHHLSVGTIRRNLVEFLELHQGNRSVYDYTQEFNNLAQYEGHHMDSDAKKAELYRKGLNIQLQDRFVQNLSLSYNDLASTAIDQEGTMKACEVAEEKKRTTPGPTRGSSSGAPPKYHMVYTPHAGLPRRPPQFLGNHQPFQPQQQYTCAPFTPQHQGAARLPQHVTPVGYPCYNCGKVGHFAKD
jgi:hypothetical protein